MSEPTRRSWVNQIMGMPVSVHLRGTTPDEVRAPAVDAAFADLVEVDRIFSTYREDSEISRVRRGELGIDDCTPLVAEVLELCTQASRLTSGYFSVALPGPDGELRLDLSGLVKGWAVQRAARHLAALDDDYYLSAGGDIALRSGAMPWRFGIEDPRDPAAHIAVLECSSGGVATSGTTHRGMHIIDPTTGKPATGLLSATVVGPELLWADVFATAVCARGVDALAYLDFPPGYEAMAVTAEGWMLTTSGMAVMLGLTA